MIKAIIFDLNGVFIQSRRLSERFEESFNIPQNKFLSVLEEILPQARLMKSGGSFALWAPYFKQWNIDLTEQQFWDFWFSGETENLEMFEFVKNLKSEHIKIFILSNNFTERANYYQNHFPAIDQIANKIYYSWQTGFLKSNPQAYHNILKENKLEAEECLFFDDKLENVELAKSLKINSYLFYSLTEIKDVITTQINSKLN